MESKKRAHRAQFHLALHTGLVSLAVAGLVVVNAVRWPVVGMGGAVVQMVLLWLLAIQVVPLAGLGVAYLIRRKGAHIRPIAYWVWFGFASVALLLGGWAAIGLLR